MATANEFSGLVSPWASLRKNLTSPVGHAITPAVSVWVTQLGRWFHSGNTHDHIVRIWQSGVTGAAIASGTVLVAATSDSIGFKWVTLATPIQLVAGTSYFVVSEEVNVTDDATADEWPDSADWEQLIDPAVFDLTGSKYSNGGAGAYPNLGAAGSNSYGSATFKYNLSSPAVPANEVQLIGTVIKSGEDATNTAAKAIDGTFTTYWQSASANTGWIGLDAGAAVTPTRVRFAPRGGASGTVHESKIEGSLVQGSSASDFSVGPTTLDTLPTRPTLPYAPRSQLTERSFTAGATFRYLRLINTGTGNYGGMFAEMRWIAQGSANTTTNARPMEPVISPGGGRYPSARCELTLSCPTDGVDIYYTTDGTTPSWSNGTLYSAPFWIQWTLSKTVKAIAYHPRLSAEGSEVTTRVFYDKGFAANTDWYDDRGILLEAHSGHILDNRARNGLFYWYGTSMNSHTNSSDTTNSMGVLVYSSTDLLNWTYVGNILPQPTGFFAAVRCHVIYNSSTAKYVLWMHAYNNPPGATDRAAVGTSSSPGSGWTWSNEALNPDGLGFKDCCLFQDTDGTAYALYTRGDQNGIIISRLASDYLTTSGSYIEVLSGTVSESPAMLKRNGVYFFIYGSANAYNSVGQEFSTAYKTATSPLGTWSSSSYLHYSKLHSSSPVGTAYNAQISQVLLIDEYSDGYVFVGDFWTGNGSELYGSRYVLLPLYFPSSTTLQVGEPTDWMLSGHVFNSIGNNFVINSGGRIRFAG